MDIQEANTFKDVMGFNVATNEVFYEDDATDTTIPDIQVNFIRINILCEIHITESDTEK